MLTGAENPDPSLLAVIRSLPPLLPKSSFRVFVFGPYLRPEQTPPCPDERADIVDHARYLRRHIANALAERGWTVDFGESAQVLAAWMTLRGPVDAARMEFEHAKVACGAVVILPSSPGSFCEMGLFSASKEIAAKTLAIVHADYENAESFFRNGLVRVFQSRMGTCKYKSYRDHRSVLSCVQEFVEDRYSAVHWDDHDIQTGELRRRQRELVTA